MVNHDQTSSTIDRLEAAMDRIQEAHWFLHDLEEYYHFADPFRWHLNAFLRALKEVPQLISMGLQNGPGLPEWFRPRRDALIADPLIRHLSVQRDFIVHRGMLLPSSSAMVGITDGRGIKFGMGVKVDPMVNSDELMRRFIEASLQSGDFLGVLQEDEESLPCVERHWRLPEFGGEDLVDLCARAWVLVAECLRGVYERLGVDLNAPALNCRHGAQAVRLRVYPRDALARGEFKGYRLPDGRDKPA